MTRQDFDTFCAPLPAATHVVQWGGSSVWKVGGKIFALCSGGRADGAGTGGRISFKCSDLSYRMLIEQPGIVPAPYLARAQWVQVVDPDALDEDGWEAYLTAAHGHIARRLTRKQRQDLCLNDL
ncbi:MmcQ/YjbR family DNA-binding protein [Roseibium aestuarii]|uniref:MmcQ/YjbR family DNA-binding protein n=1 Tax=Roseibium aestuarii TaxID=2600299 RepID=A0ABW4K3X5_9HYPH|nr:MmcQ/YjbR family DNA-binding protein [Roseibium aestuarii]